MFSKIKVQDGITLPEVLIALALFLIFIIGVSSLIYIGLDASAKGATRTRASLIAQEGIEAVFALRQDGEINFSPSPGSDTFITGPSEYYLPSISGGQWELGSKQTVQPPANLPSPNEDFRRTLRIEKVLREPAGLACIGKITTDPTGCEDPNTRKVISEVSWQEKGDSKSIQIVSYITNI